MSTNWYTVAPPHEDIREGDFDESVFAAKLGDTVTADPSPRSQDRFLRDKYTKISTRSALI